MFNKKLSASHLAAVRTLDGLMAEVARHELMGCVQVSHLTFDSVRSVPYEHRGTSRREASVALHGGITTTSGLIQFEAFLIFDAALNSPWEIETAEVSLKNLPHSFRFRTGNQGDLQMDKVQE
jgi:hypothetical protein